ncbi:MAG: DUF1836 domain-containing protein [Lachnospiraceae bacterium]
MNTINFQEFKEAINNWIKLDYIEPEDIPSIELYMDQVTTFMDKQLAGNKRDPEDKILTKTMINNYSKNDLLPPSNKKRYSKDHIILLIYIYYLKNFLSIGDIQSLLEPMTHSYFQSENGIGMLEIYKDLFALEKQYGIKVRESIQEVYEIAENNFPIDDDYLKTFAMITMLSYDIYEKKQIIERLVDSLRENYTVEDTALEERLAKEQQKQKDKVAKEIAKKKEKEAKIREKAAKKVSKPL